VAYKGSLPVLLYQLIGGLRAGMGYCGVRYDRPKLRTDARFIQVSPARSGRAIRMTLPLSKNRQTTRPNTRRWSRLKLAVLGASVLWNLAPMASADQPASGIRSRDTSPPAAARWKIIKRPIRSHPQRIDSFDATGAIEWQGRRSESDSGLDCRRTTGSRGRINRPAYERTPERAPPLA